MIIRLLRIAVTKATAYINQDNIIYYILHLLHVQRGPKINTKKSWEACLAASNKIRLGADAIKASNVK